MQSDFKVVCVDLDGTLLPRTKKITQTTVDYLVKLQERGIKVIVCTGRNPLEIKEIATLLKSAENKSYMVSCNGQFIEDFNTGIPIENKRLSQEDCIKIFDLAKKYNILGFVDNDSEFYQTLSIRTIPLLIKRYIKVIRNLGWVFKQFAGRKIIYTFNPQKFVKNGLRKIGFYGEYADLQQFSIQLEKQLPNQFSRMFISKSWFEIMDIHVSKGHAIQQLSDLIHIPLSQFIAFGDGENDITMLESAGWGVAMDNALDSVKAISDDITLTSDDEGVIHYLKKIGL